MIDLYSDTLTQPTPAMRLAMADAVVGDEQRREDPTTNLLQERVAAMLGKESAVYLPSGAMCNAIAIKTHTQPSDAILCDRYAHVLRSEFGSHAMLSGVTSEPIDGGDRGRFTATHVRETFSKFGSYGAIPRLLCVEQTHTYGGGSVWPLAQLRDVCAASRERKMLTHMDGARLLNASIASGVSPKDFAESFDSVWIDLSKGLGCPVGAVLAGSADFIARAWRWKHIFGGALRQSGMLAAAGLYALDHHVERLRDDHENAKLLAKGLAQIPGIALETPEPETNSVVFRLVNWRISTADFLARTLERGVRFSGLVIGIRAMTHLGISREDVATALKVVRDVLSAD